MRLHRRGETADWDRVRLARRNLWQRLAGTSHGVLTPANVVSLGGLVLVAWGSALLIQQHYLAGLIAILGGRLADVADGFVAERTKTKSSLGETVDATVDKLALLFLLPAIMIEHLIPFVILGIIILQSGINVGLALFAKAKKVELQPTANGKIATAALWLCLIAFAAVAVANRTGLEAFELLLQLIAYGATGLFAGFGFLSSREYAQVLRAPRRSHLVQEVGRVIVIVNPKSSHAARIEKRTRELAKLFSGKPIVQLETTARPAGLEAKLKKALAKPLDGLTVVAIGGGDGTVNTVVNALMCLTSQVNLARTPVLPLWGGNANDFACMLNGLPSRTTLQAVFDSAELIPVYPFEITLQKNSQVQPTVRYAACYASFGASAYAAAELEKPSTKAAVREVAHVAKAIVHSPAFEAEQDGQRIKIFEQAFVNGSRMAKIDRIPVQLHEKRFYRAVKTDTQPSFWDYASLLIRGKQTGEVTDKTFHFTTKDRVHAQFDGEPTILPKNTHISVRHASAPFYALSTKLK